MADRYGPTKDSGRALHRGTGCHICRQRKVRCDGTRPACGRCVKSRSECTYDEEIKKSKITLLRDEISELKKRIQELEGGGDQKLYPLSIPQQSLSPVAVPLSSWAGSPALSDAHSINSFTNHGQLNPDQKPLFNVQGVSQMSLAPTYQQTLGVPGLGGYQTPVLQDAAVWGGAAPLPSGTLIYSQLDQPLTIQQTLHYLQIIMPYRLQCAFEIDILSFRESLEDPDPNNQPHEALLNAIALMACYYDQTLREANRAQFFVERTRRSLQLSLTGVRSRKVIQQIQAGHLLSCYLYWTGSLLEGHAALAGAVSLGTYNPAYSVHRIPSHDTQLSSTMQSPQNHVFGLAKPER
ncbi:hypothetical protein B0J17DRAFT_637499 [Rhizoctonia solani]|nr:hypothetical protein B0J17DRAFT_637499 [Rhizoctonia solani]